MSTLELIVAVWLVLGITASVITVWVLRPRKKEKLPPCETCGNLSSKDRDGHYECKFFHHRYMVSPLEYCKDYEPRERKDKNHAEM